MFHQVYPEVIFQSHSPSQRCHNRRYPNGRYVPVYGLNCFNPMMMAGHEGRDNGENHFIHFMKALGEKHGTCQEPDGTKCRREKTCTPSACQKPTGPIRNNNKTTVLAKLNFREFSPSEIRVKVTEKNVLVKGRHEDHSGFSETTRSVPLPSTGFKLDVTSRYENGFVILEVSRKSSAENGDEKAAVNREQTVNNDKVDTEKKQEAGQKTTTGSDDPTEKDRKAEEYARQSVRNLQEIFSSIFGIPLFHVSDSDSNKESETAPTVAKESETAPTVAKESEAAPTVAKESETAPTVTKESETAPTVKKEADTEDEMEPVDKTDQDEQNETEEKPSHEREVHAESGDKTDEPVQLKVKPSCSPAGSDEKDSELSVPEKKDESMTDQDFNTFEFVEVRQENSQMTNEEEASETKSSASNEVTDVTKGEGETDQTVSVQSKFEVVLDMSKFKPDDVRVLFSDGHVIVSGEREIKGDNYTEVEKWSRQIQIPQNVDESKLRSIVDDEGFMTIEAPFKCD